MGENGKLITMKIQDPIAFNAQNKISRSQDLLLWGMEVSLYFSDFVYYDLSGTWPP